MTSLATTPSCFCHRIESSFARLSEQLDRQGLLLGECKARLDASASAGDLAALAERANARMLRVERMVERLAEACDPARGGDGSVGRLAARNTEELARVRLQLQASAGVDELRGVRSEAAAALGGLAQELRGTLAHQAVVESVEASVGTMREQVGALQALVACKVDNADIASLRATAAKIETHQDFHARVSDDIATLQGQHRDLGATVAAGDAAAQRTRAALRGVKEEAGTKADRDAVAALGAAMRVVQRKLAAAATRERADALAAGQDAVRASLADAHGRLDAAVAAREAEVGRLDALVAGKADAAQLRGKVGVDESEAEMGRLRGDHGGRLDRLGAAAERHAAGQAELKREVGVALRFVEWFSDRGEAFEHNFGVVERELSVLAKRSDPRGGHRQPFSKDNVRIRP